MIGFGSALEQDMTFNLSSTKYNGGTSYTVGRITGHVVSALGGIVGVAGGTTGGILTSPTGVGAVAGAEVVVYSGGVAITAAYNLADELTTAYYAPGEGGGGGDDDGEEEAADPTPESDYDPSTRNPAQDKMLSNGEIKRMKNAGIDIHAEKGRRSTGKIDLYKDGRGNIYIKPKGGKGFGEPTEYNINDY